MSRINKTRQDLIKRFALQLIFFGYALISNSQQVNKPDDWWTAVIKKHNIKFDSYTLHGNYFIIGEKTNEGDIEIFKNVIVIPKSSEGYWIIKSNQATYDSTTTILKINDCTMESFSNDPKSLNPIESYDHTDFIINIEKNNTTGSYVGKNNGK